MFDLAKALKEDKTVYNAYRTSIATAFIEEYRKYRFKRIFFGPVDVAVISKRAATKFLNSLIED